jgi:large subunit ribosomal protein L32e
MKTAEKTVKKLAKKPHPNFRRHEKYFMPALPDNWRKPKGHHSKIRRAKKWKPRMPNVGWCTPKSIKNTDKSGRKLVMIKTVNDLKLLIKDTIGIVCAKLGLKSKEEIAKACSGKNYVFTNFKPENILKLAIEKRTKTKTEEKKPAIKLEEHKEEKPVKPVKPSKPVKLVKGDKE